MKQFLSLAILLTLTVGCGSSGSKKNGSDTSQQEVSEVDQFINEYSSQYINDKEYLSAYQDYLTSVQAFYRENGIEEKFGSYLQSLRENNRELAQLRKKLIDGNQQAETERPWTGDSKDESGPHDLRDENRMQEEVDREINDWRNEAEGVGETGMLGNEQGDKKIKKKLNKTSMMTEKYDQVLQEREDQLKADLGEDIFSDLKENYRNFQAKYEGTKFYFPI